MSNSEEIFRKKSLDRIKSPESLNDCIRVANPGVWLVLIAAIALLIGACLWGVLGRIETTVETEIRAEDGIAICSTEAADYLFVRVNDTDYSILAAERGSSGVELVCPGIPDGTYPAEIVTERIQPMEFLFN